MKKVLLLVQAALALLFVNASGQPTENWIFGQNASLRIGSVGPQGSFGGFGTNFIGGSASASDANGNLLFYTDGNTVYNPSGGTMSGGTGLSGYTSSISSSPVIIPKPGSPCEYYIFSITGFQDVSAGIFNNGIVYATVNTSTQQVTSINNYITPSGVNILQDKIAASTDGKGGYWLVVHGLNFLNPTNDFYSYHITTAGVLYPIVSLIGSPAPSCGFATIVEKLYAASGQETFSEDGSILAVTTMSCNQFELFSFNKSTGQVLPFTSNANQPIRITESDMASTTVGNFGGSSCFGIQTSPDNSKLYVGTSQPLNGSSDYVLEFDLTALNTSSVLHSAALITSYPNYGYMQYGMFRLGPDQRIYIARNSSPYLSVINNPNNNAANCSYSDNGLYISGTCYLGLPSAVSGLTSLFTINSDGKTTYCAGQSLNLSIYNLPVLGIGDYISWQGPTGMPVAGNTTLSVSSLALSDAGTYTATIYLGNCGSFQTSIQIIVNNCSSPSNPCQSLHAAFYSNGLNPMQFTNASASLAPITYYHWDFGDGTTSTEVNPIHQYNVVRDYVVCLTIAIIDSNGCCSDSVCKRICCVPPPLFNCSTDVTPGFTANIDNSIAGKVDFTNTTIVTGGIEPTYSWDFGDNNTSQALQPSNIYSLSGTYHVCLNVINPFTNEICSTYCSDVTVNSGLSMLRSMAFISPNFMAVSPNPSSEYIDINYKNICSPTARIMIYNIYGQEEFNVPVNTDISTLRVNVNNWASGLYTVKLLADGEMLQAQKFCKIQD